MVDQQDWVTVIKSNLQKESKTDTNLLLKEAFWYQIQGCIFSIAYYFLKP
jgi:hypothetical protein